MKIGDIVIYNRKWYHNNGSLDEEIMIVNSIRFLENKIIEINGKCIEGFRKLSEKEHKKFIK